MNTRPNHPKRSHLKHPGPKGLADAGEQSWVRRFWILLGVLATLSAVTVFYYTRDIGAEADEVDAYVSLQVRTQVGNGQIIVCKLSLLVDPEQEKGIQGRQKVLEAVVSQALSEIYQRPQRPDLPEVRQSLYFAINHKLPRKLQVRDVLVQELLAGLS